ncbi:tyrosine-type recombinase/integrase [Streptomyces meridianus]|uniref:Site-specific integrase n=1 Tax=Streptomyces meridianus TaxID=2938945 RepID=A0ABT0X8J6_9ACTN|nr:tyrosine-type recombinase/integrase [Streptomyces meridianus]MCM2578851.1 site-specific integrase [Streptomyces meridianus]
MALRWQRLRLRAEQATTGRTWDPNGLIFVTREGRPIEPGNLNRDFSAVCKKAAINRRVRVHDLRHTCATLLLAQGVDARCRARHVNADAACPLPPRLRTVSGAVRPPRRRRGRRERPGCPPSGLITAAYGTFPAHFGCPRVGATEEAAAFSFSATQVDHKCAHWAFTCTRCVINQDRFMPMFALIFTPPLPAALCNHFVCSRSVGVYTLPRK